MKETPFDLLVLERASATVPLSQLDGSLEQGRPLRVGIDASHYLLRFTGKEPLNGALGGDPLSLEDKIMVELNEFKKASCQIIFYFHGSSWGPLFDPFLSTNKAADLNKQAFSKYEEADPKTAINLFKKTDMAELAPYLEWFKSMLARHQVPFVVAPFSAFAQMIDAFEQNAIDTYYASTEIFLFGAKQIIYSIDLRMETQELSNGNAEDPPAANHQESMVRFVDFDHVVAILIRYGESLVKDAMYLTGSSQLPAFTPFADDATAFDRCLEQLAGFSGNVEALIKNAAGVDDKAKTEYFDDYVKVLVSVTNMPLLTHINEVIARSASAGPLNIPKDLAMIMAIQPPEELNYYMFTGMVSPKLVSMLTVNRITIPAPFAGGDKTYEKMVSDTLEPYRRQNYEILASQCSRGLQFRPVETRYWFKDGVATTYALRNDSPSYLKGLSTWRVRDPTIAARAAEVSAEPGSLLFALKSVADGAFASKTYTRKSSDPANWDADQLSSETELTCNTIWRMLMVRGYLTDKHELTAWGKTALAGLEVAGTSTEQAEAVFVAIELLRAGHFTPKAILAQHAQEEDTHKRYTWFVAKVLTAGQMVHHSKGYSGPLSRQLLAFHSSVSAARASLRESTEATAANLLLGGDGTRPRDDFPALAAALPFRGRFSCGLAVLMSTYLDEYQSSVKEPVPPVDTPARLSRRMQDYCAHTLIQSSLERAVQIWDGLMAAVRAAAGSANLIDADDAAKFEAIDAWFAGRRPDTKKPVPSTEGA